MPELPEVETVMRGLRAALEGQVLSAVEIRRRDLRWPISAEIPGCALGRRVMSLARRGKYILMRLDNATSLLLHLGMSGRILVDRKEDDVRRKHEHVVFYTEGGTRVGFVDPRRFGALLALETAGESDHPLLTRLGLEPLGRQIGVARLAALLEGRRTPIKVALLDQSLIAGLGNIYVCEVLYRAHVHPETPSSALTSAQIGRIARAIPIVIEEAVAAGGSSLRDYVQADGTSGGFQELHRVYGRENAPCPECPGAPQCGGVERIVQAGRSSFFCPLHQRHASDVTRPRKRA